MADNSNKLFKSHKTNGRIGKKELIQFKRVTNLGMLYLLPEIQKRLENVPGRSVISNCGTLTEKVLEFLDS